MVFLAIQIKCDLENLTDLKPENEHYFTYYFKVKCSSCGEVSGKESSVSRNEKVEGKSGSKSSAHLVQKCGFCGRQGSIVIVDGRGRPYTAEDSEKGAFAPIVVLDCRGIEPVEFMPKDGWVAAGVESGTVFSDIDLSEGEYSEYDEKASEAIGIYNLVSEIVVTKG